jgi:hypothetical protein
VASKSRIFWYDASRSDVADLLRRGALPLARADVLAADFFAARPDDLG